MADPHDPTPPPADSSDRPSLELDTLAVHAGERRRAAPEPAAVPSAVPLHLATSFYYERVEDLDAVFEGTRSGFNYGRYGNPTRAALEELLAALDGGDFAHATASGMAAIHLAILASLTDRARSVLASDALYGQSMALLDGPLRSSGIAVRFADATDAEGFARAIAESRPGVVYLEALSNPLLRVPRLDRIVALAHETGARVVVDSTFTPPVMLRPLSLEADVVVHSLTKYLAGHGDVLAGAVIAREELRAPLHDLAKTLGPTLSPFDSYLALRGIKTLSLRFARQCENAARISRFLEAHPRVAGVRHPGLPSHPDAEAIALLFPPGLHGGMLAFELAGAGRDEVFAFIDALRLVVPATTLGDVQSLALYPAMSSHRALRREQRLALGITDGLVRLSLGIEAASDIERDLANALGG